MEHVHQYNEAVTKLKLLLDQSNFEQSAVSNIKTPTSTATTLPIEPKELTGIQKPATNAKLEFGLVLEKSDKVSVNCETIKIEI